MSFLQVRTIKEYDPSLTLDLDSSIGKTKTVPVNEEFQKSVNALRVSYTDYSEHQMNIEISKYNPEDHPEFFNEVANIEEAEDRLFDFLNAMEPGGIFDKPEISANSHPCVDADVDVALVVMINREANKIAQRTRRGTGNLVLIHPDNLDLLKDSGAYRNGPPMLLNNTMVINPTEKCPKDKVFVLYQCNLVLHEGNTDGGFLFVDHQATGRKYIFTLPNDENHLGTAHDYVGSVQLKGI